MSDQLTPDPPDVSAAGHPETHREPSADQLAELRRILVGRERADIDELQDRLAGLSLDAHDVSEILPDAIVHSAQRDQRLSKALAPTLEDAMKRSVRRNPGALAEALFPVLGPAIRRAIAQAMSGLIQAINTATQHNLSWRGLRWRVEAMRTGVPFAQVVLRHTLVYAVEQVFLIHRDTGLPLCHAAAETGVQRDADLVSGMLTAIQDFMTDSFGVEREGVRTFTVGEFTVRVEQGPRAVLAAVIRGHAPNELRVVLQDAIETVHLEFGEELAEFEGEAAPFERAQPLLEACLKMQVAERKQRRGLLSPAIISVLAIVLLLVATWAFFSIRTARRWSRLIERLRAEPGVVVAEAERRRGRFILTGLRDPLATDPAEIIAESQLDLEDVNAQWEAYASFHPLLVTRRAQQVLQPPPSVSLELRHGTLSASGTAPGPWIDDARRLAPTIPGVTAFNTRDLQAGTSDRFVDLRGQLERQRILFSVGSADLGPAQRASLDAIASLIEVLRNEAGTRGQGITIQLLGRTDASGSEATNRLLSEQRATAVRDALIARGLPAAMLRIVAVAADRPLPDDATSPAARINRSVSFQILHSEGAGASRGPG